MNLYDVIMEIFKALFIYIIRNTSPTLLTDSLLIISHFVSLEKVRFIRFNILTSLYKRTHFYTYVNFEIIIIII